MAEKLKPCPFCGGYPVHLEPIIAHDNNIKGGRFITANQIQCDECHIATPIDMNIKTVIKMWNRRTK